MERRRQIRGGSSTVMDGLWSQTRTISTNTDSVFVLNCYIIDYELSIMDGSVLRGITVQHHKEMSHRRAEPSCTIRLSSAVCAAHPALILITTNQLLMLMIIRGSERLKYEGMFGHRQEWWSLRRIFHCNRLNDVSNPKVSSNSDENWLNISKSLTTFRGLAFV